MTSDTDANDGELLEAINGLLDSEDGQAAPKSEVCSPHRHPPPAATSSQPALARHVLATFSSHEDQQAALKKTPQVRARRCRINVGRALKTLDRQMREGVSQRSDVLVPVADLSRPKGAVQWQCSGCAIAAKAGCVPQTDLLNAYKQRGYGSVKGKTADGKRIAGNAYYADRVTSHATSLMNSLTGAAPTAWHVSNFQELTDCRRQSASFKTPRVNSMQGAFSEPADVQTAQVQSTICYILPPQF